VLAGTPNGLTGDGGPGEAAAVGRAATVAAFDAPLAAGPLLQPVTTLLAAITARTPAVTAAWRRRAAAAPRISRLTERNSVLSTAHVQYGTDVQKT